MCIRDRSCPVSVSVPRDNTVPLYTEGKNTGNKFQGISSLSPGPSLQLHHPVPHADVGLDILGVAGVHLQLFAQSGHADAERGGIRKGGDAPNLVEDKIVGEDLPGISGQQAEQIDVYKRQAYIVQ